VKTFLRRLTAILLLCVLTGAPLLAATVTFLEPGTDATQDVTFFSVANSFVGGTGTSIASASDQAHTGTRSLKAIIANSGDAAYEGTANGVVTDAGSAVSFWVRFSTVTPSVSTGFFFISQANDNQNILAIGLNTTGKLIGGALTVGAVNNQTTGATTLSANTWYRLDESYVITSASSWSASIYLNGSLEISMSNSINSTLAAVSTNMLEFGVDQGTGFNATSVITVWFDDIYADNRTDSSDPGAIQVTAKRPFTNGTSVGFTTQIGAGGSGYGSGHTPQVNEQPLSQTDGWAVTVVASAITEEYNLEGLSVGDVNLTGASIKGVQMWIFCKSLLTETDQIMADGTLSNISVTSTPALFVQNSPNPTTYPASAGTDVGMKTNTTATTASLYEGGALIAYTPGSGGAATPPPFLPLLGVGPGQ